MEEIYTDLKNPASLSSPRNLLNEIRKTDENVKLKDVENFLATKDSYTLHKVKKHKFSKQFFMFNKPGDYLLSDVTYLTAYSSSKAKFLLVFQDGFSRFIWCYPLNNLKAESIIKCTQDVLMKSLYKIRYFFSDRGQEYKSNKFLNFLRNKNIKPYHTFSDVKVGTIEIFNRTVKRKIIKIVTEKNTENVLEIIPQIIQTYNITPNRGILFETPMDIYMENDIQKLLNFRERLY